MKSKYLAGLSLAIMAAGFVVTLFLPGNLIVYLLRGGFEAGLVGGIADWFAVTALFRHPLGIPIPHTSLLLKNREKIIQSLISAMENELLNKKSIENKLRSINILPFLSSALTKLLSRKKVRLGILDMLTQMVLRLPVQKAVPFIQSGVSAYIRQFDAKSAANSVLTKAMQDGHEQKALDYVIAEAAKWVERPDTQVMFGKLAGEKLAEVKMNGLMGFAVQAFAGFMNEEKMGEMLQGMLLSGIRSLLDKDSAHRDMILQEIRTQLFQLADNEDRLNQWKEAVVDRLGQEDVQSHILVQLEQLRRLILDKLEEERAKGGRVVFTFYRSTLRSLSKESEWMEVWENRLLSYLVHLVETNHYRIGRLVKENLDQLDDAALVSMLEEKVGKDLQWIRVNGALCGFLVGIVLSLIQLI